MPAAPAPAPTISTPRATRRHRAACAVALGCLFLAGLALQAMGQVAGTAQGVGVVGGMSPGTEKRVALVVGNAAYRLAPLKNPVNDARALGRTLVRLGFDVTVVENTSKTELERAIGQFGRKLGPDGVGLFFFAGHGIQVNGRNFLVPIDAAIETEPAVKLEAVDVEVVLDQMQAAKSRVNIVVLDACRNDPFARGFRSASRGLASIDAPVGTLIAYATAPGRTAADGDGANGLYTEELLKALETPGLRVEDVLKRTRVGVIGRSKGQQTPWDSSSLVGDFYFSPVAAASPVLASTPAGSPADARPAVAPSASVPVPAAGAPAAVDSAPTYLAAVDPRSPANPAVDGVWSLALRRCGLFSRFEHELVGRRVAGGKMVGRSSNASSPERWDLAFTLAGGGALEIAGTLTTQDGRTGTYRVTARERSTNDFAGAAEFLEYKCEFEGRRLPAR